MVVSSALCKYEGNIVRQRGKLGSESFDDEQKHPRKQRKVISQPVKDIDLDSENHLPRFIDDKNASKCRMAD